MTTPRTAWVEGKLFVLGSVVSQWKVAREVKKRLQNDGIEVVLVKIQPPPVWEIWGHDLEGTTEEVKEVKPSDTLELTTVGKIDANVIMELKKRANSPDATQEDLKALWQKYYDNAQAVGDTDAIKELEAVVEKVEPEEK